MRIIVLTQEDKFFIPKNIEKVIKGHTVISVVNVNCKSSLNNRISDFIKWFGLLQVAKMGVKTINRTVLSICDKISGYKLAGGYCSVKDISMKHNVEYLEISNVNSTSFIDYVKEQNPDLIISYSAPQVIKPMLLSLPKHGIINVHGSLLPDYRGCLPSFWYLFNEEKEGGATVHYMSEKIDDGDIIKQGRVSLEGVKSMFDIMHRTKALGGEIMLQAINDIEDNSVQVRPNKTAEGRYFTWPSADQAKEFRNSGKKLI